MNTNTGQIPPDVTGVTTGSETADVDVLAVPVFGAEDDLADLEGVDAAVGGALSRARSSGEFRAEPYDVFVAQVTGGWTARRLAFVGAGSVADADALRVRRLGVAVGLKARKMAAGSVGMLVRRVPDAAGAAGALVDGLCAAEFDTGRYKEDRARGAWTPQSVRIVAPGADAAALSDAVRRGRIIGECANAARSLANEPGNVLTPREFAGRVAMLARETGLTAEILDEQQMDRMGMGLLLGVARGSAEPPRLLVLRHEPASAPVGPVLGLIGKGITFDTGGISLKPAEAMDRMKYDMSGGAAVAGAMLAIARLGGPHRVIAVIPMAENMPGGRAIRPGDILTGASGRTVEITNTDAEGRLILGDALWYAGELGATHLVDVATLTGACVIALGRWTSGLLGNDDEWVDAVKGAGERAGDRVWRLPLYEEAREQLRSEIADLVNAAGRDGGGGTVTAATFLREFVGERPWAHLDIAGTAWCDKATAFQAKGPTGAAVRLLTELGVSGAPSSRR